MDLAPTIAGRAGWPCVEQAWSDCAVRFAPGGLTPAEWYEETRFEASEYPVAVDADGAPVGEPGVEVAVGTARALYDALENRDVSRIRVLNSFSLPDLRDWRWPDEGYPVRRDLALFADAACATASARDEEREEEDADAAARGEVAGRRRRSRRAVDGVRRGVRRSVRGGRQEEDVSGRLRGWGCVYVRHDPGKRRRTPRRHRARSPGRQGVVPRLRVPRRAFAPLSARAREASGDASAFGSRRGRRGRRRAGVRRCGVRGERRPAAHGGGARGGARGGRGHDGRRIP